MTRACLLAAALLKWPCAVASEFLGPVSFYYHGSGGPSGNSNNNKFYM